MKDLFVLAIAMEDDGVEFYKNLADSAENSKDSLFYKPHTDKIVWNEDKGFYKELEEQIVGQGAASFYHQSMPQKVSKGDSASFYKSMGERVTDDVKSVLIGMSDEEKRHGDHFRKLLAEAEISGVFAEGASEFLKTHSDKLTFNKKEAAPKSIIEALDKAIETEEGAVEFYSGILKYANEESKAVLKEIIAEEKMHKSKLKVQKNKYELLTKDYTVV
jgi:rubrerythrin